MTARKSPAAKPAEPEVATLAPAEVTAPAEPETAAAPAAKPAGAELISVVMQVAVAGSHDGVPWPPIGGVANLPALDAAELIRLGYAKPAAD